MKVAAWLVTLSGCASQAGFVSSPGKPSSARSGHPAVLDLGRGGLVGATIDIVLPDGTPSQLVVKAGRPAPAPLDDVWFYDVYERRGDQLVPRCGSQPDGTPISAIALEGQWNERVGTPGAGSRIPNAGGFTFACRGKTLAKCVEMGYRPWVTHPTLGPLADHHQACVRLLRADYCGDGRSFTRDGTTVNVYDAAGLQKDTENWRPEAEWSAAGAVCLNQRRRGNEFPWPDCFAKQTDAQRRACGDPKHFGKRVLLISESRPLPPPSAAPSRPSKK